ncbi:MAG: hypothetical protein ACOZAJ_02280 [Patescibacteria group bacterium]
MKKKNSLTGSVLTAVYEPFHFQNIINDLKNMGLKVTVVNNYDDTVIESKNGFDLTILSTLMYGSKKIKKYSPDKQIIKDLLPELRSSGKKFLVLANQPTDAGEIAKDKYCLGSFQMSDVYCSPKIITKTVIKFFNYKNRTKNETPKDSTTRRSSSSNHRTAHKKSSQK